MNKGIKNNFSYEKNCQMNSTVTIFTDNKDIIINLVLCQNSPKVFYKDRNLRVLKGRKSVGSFYKGAHYTIC